MDHHSVRAVVAYCVLSIAAFPAATISAQTAAPPAVNAPPPIKMGLWESNVTQTITGLQLPPGVAEKLKEMGRPAPDAPQTSVYETCMTPEQWNKNMSAMQTQNKNCTRSNEVENSHRMSFDMTCTAPRPTENSTEPDAQNSTGPAPANSTGHMEMIYESPEKTHGTMTMKGVQMGPQGAPVDVVIKMETRFLSSACGDLKPGENRPVVKK